MRLLVLAAAVSCAYADSRFPFSVAAAAEVIATIQLSSPGADWAVRGREAAVATLQLDGKLHQHIITYAGPKRHEYRVSLGQLTPGKHEVVIGRDASQSAAALEVHTFQVQEIAATHADYEVFAKSPVLFARLNTVGKFSDIPLLLYCERKSTGVLEYTVIFSNEDGGTSTRALMARWGRTTDIEYVYRSFPGSRKAIVQGPGHKDLEFTGDYEGEHPFLMPVTDNNMIAAAKDSPLRFRLAPMLVDLSNDTRESVMDRVPVTHTVMAKELEREAKLRPFGAVEGEKISDQRNYLYVDYQAALAGASLTVEVRTRDGRGYASDLGRADLAIARDEIVRTTIELPPNMSRDEIASLGFACRIPPPAKDAGPCRLLRVIRVFSLQQDYTPGPSRWALTTPVSIPAGHSISFRQ